MLHFLNLCDIHDYYFLLKTSAVMDFLCFYWEVLFTWIQGFASTELRCSPERVSINMHHDWVNFKSKRQVEFKTLYCCSKKYLCLCWGYNWAFFFYKFIPAFTFWPLTHRQHLLTVIFLFFFFLYCFLFKFLFLLYFAL